MQYDLLDLFNIDPDDDIQESLRLALMFKEEVDEATRGYMDMLHISIDQSSQTPEEVNRVVREAINAALLTGIRAYRSWIHSEGVNVIAVEENSGKDFPRNFIHKDTPYPL